MFPKFKKNISDLIEDEEGNIPGNKLLMLGTMIVVLGSMMQMDAVQAVHGSHKSHTSHSSHGSHGIMVAIQVILVALIIQIIQTTRHTVMELLEHILVLDHLLEVLLQIQLLQRLPQYQL